MDMLWCGVIMLFGVVVVASDTTSVAHDTFSAKKKKYNILFLMCDSMDGRVLDPRSPISQYLEMPYMWSLAGQGLNFVNTYSNNPQCAPSRSSMFTGRHTHQIKAWANEKALVATPGSGLKTGQWELDQTCVDDYDTALCQQWASQQNVTATFMDTLEEIGLTVALYGKVDVGGNVIRRPEQKKYNPTVDSFHGGPSLATVGRAADIHKATKSRPQAKTHVPTGKIHSADWQVVSECMQWLEDNKDATGQWMLYCSLVIPHPPYECNPDTEAEISRNMPLPEWFTDPDDYPEKSMHPYDVYMSIAKSMMDEQGNFSRHLLHQNMRCWYAMCNQTDEMLGLVWAKAGETGNLKNTIVIFTSDHGEMHMEHRQHLKNSMFEGSSRVPLIIAGPGSKPGIGTRQVFENGKSVSDLASLLDMYPTFVDAAGSTLPDFLSGESLMPYLTGAGKRQTNYVVSMYMSNMANTNAFMIRKGRWKYIAYGQYGPDVYKTYHPQLFDLYSDPNELKDLSQTKHSMVTKLDSLLRSVVDYDAVDREVKMEERMLYDRYFKSKFTKAKLRQKWEKSFTGFDDTDEAQVEEWYRSVESASQPDDPFATIVV